MDTGRLRVEVLPLEDKRLSFKERIKLTKNLEKKYRHFELIENCVVVYY